MLCQGVQNSAFDVDDKVEGNCTQNPQVLVLETVSDIIKFYTASKRRKILNLTICICAHVCILWLVSYDRIPFMNISNLPCDRAWSRGGTNRITTGGMWRF